jgi:hypothetical protein
MRLAWPPNSRFDNEPDEIVGEVTDDHEGDVIDNQ